jgi:hypothetical protein
MKLGFRFRLGLVLLTTNQPLGWGALLLCAALAVKTGRKELYYWGIVAYGLSWVMLGVGVVLAGRDGLQYARLHSDKIKGFFSLSRRGK